MTNCKSLNTKNFRLIENFLDKVYSKPFVKPRKSLPVSIKVNLNRRNFLDLSSQDKSDFGNLLQSIAENRETDVEIKLNQKNK